MHGGYNIHTHQSSPHGHPMVSMDTFKAVALVSIWAIAMLGSFMPYVVSRCGRGVAAGTPAITRPSPPRPSALADTMRLRYHALGVIGTALTKKISVFPSSSLNMFWSR